MVQSHRCPATVSGTKSAQTTEAVGLGKAQKVGERRKPGDLLGFLLDKPFVGRVPAVLPDPNLLRLGFFLPAICYLLLPVLALTPQHRRKRW
jgi:hypothetical protein